MRIDTRSDLDRPFPPLFRPRWRFPLLGGVLALGFSFLFGALSSLTGSMGLALALGVLAYVLAGLLPGVVEPRAAYMQAREPAIGSAVATAILACLQLSALHRRMPELPVPRLVLSAVLSVAVAFGLTWLGARLGAQLAAGRYAGSSLPRAGDGFSRAERTMPAKLVPPPVPPRAPPTLPTPPTDEPV